MGYLLKAVVPLAGLCKRLTDDKNEGRQDDVSMAMWAGAVGELRVTKEFPKPTGPLRKLRKFTIPGWRGRSVAFEMPALDLQFNLQYGAYPFFVGRGPAWER